MGLSIDDYDKILRLFFKFILLLFVLALCGFFIWSLFSKNLYQIAAATSITMTSITGFMWLYIKFDTLTIVGKNPTQLTPEVLKDLLKI